MRALKRLPKPDVIRKKRRKDWIIYGKKKLNSKRLKNREYVTFICQQRIIIKKRRST
jgi:uncharacterized protein YlaI